MIRRSGIGHAMRHQMAALDTQGIEWTLNEKDDYDILHLNTVGVASERIAKKARREGKKIVVHAHSTQEDFQNSFLFSNQMSSLFEETADAGLSAGGPHRDADALFQAPAGRIWDHHPDRRGSATGSTLRALPGMSEDRWIPRTFPSGGQKERHLCRSAI